MRIDPTAGTLVPTAETLDVAALTRAYFEKKPDPAIPAQRVSFGTSGHRGSAFDTSFNEDHILAITEAICRYRKGAGIDGPLFLGRDSHALSEPAFHTALEVLSAHGVTVLVDADNGFTPRPPSAAPSSPTTRAAIRAWPTASSSRRRTTRLRMAASNTIRPMAARRNRRSRPASRKRPTPCWNKSWRA
jgi:hypothetical protein